MSFMSRSDRRIDRPLLLLTAASARPGPLDGSASWSGLGRVAQARLHRRPLGRHPVVQPRRALPAHLTPGLCRRSPPAGDRWHIRQPVPAARFTTVLPRGSSGDTGARRHRQGDGDTAEGSGFGGPETSGGVAGEPGGVRSGRWRCRSGTRSPTARDPSASLPRPAPSRPERAWPFAYPARVSAGLPERTSSRRAPYVRQGQACCARSFGARDGGVVRSGWSRARGSCWLVSRAVLGRLGCEVFWCGQACSDEPGLQAGDGAVLQDELAAVARDLLGRSEIQR
jgi:hypothetical protein